MTLLEAVPQAATTTVGLPTVLRSGMVWVPALAAIGLLFFPTRTDAHRERMRSFAIGTTGLVLGLAVVMWYGFRDQSGTFAYEETRPWLVGAGSSYHLGVDGVSMAMLLLSAFLFLFAVLTSGRVREQTKEDFILLLILETGVIGVYRVLDYLLFFHVFPHPPVAMILAGLLLKLGGYGIIRVDVGEFQEAFHRFVGAVVVIAVVTVLWSAVAALAQDNLRRLLGYVVMSHMGLVLLGAAAAVPLAINGAVLIWTSQRIFFGPAAEQYARVRDVGTLELANGVGLLSLIVLLGVLPAILMDSVNFSVLTMLSRGSG